MKRYDENDRVVLIKEGDRNEGKHGRIIRVAELVHFPVVIYDIIFDDGAKGYYFFGDIWHE